MPTTTTEVTANVVSDVDSNNTGDGGNPATDPDRNDANNEVNFIV